MRMIIIRRLFLQRTYYKDIIILQYSKTRNTILFLTSEFMQMRTLQILDLFIFKIIVF